MTENPGANWLVTVAKTVSSGFCEKSFALTNKKSKPEKHLMLIPGLSCIYVHTCALLHIYMYPNTFEHTYRYAKSQLVHIKNILQKTIMYISECLRSKKWSFGFTLTHYKKLYYF